MTNQDRPIDIEGEFHEKMINIYKRAKSECNYVPTRFLQMVNEHGGLEAAKQLLSAGGISEGLERLWKESRLDISMEATIIRQPWRQLFTDEEIAVAERKLRDLGYSHM